MRADEQLDVEPLLQGLQPVADEAGAGVGLAGRQRLNQRLPARALIEELDVEIVLGVDALRDAEAERRMAGGDLGPGKADLRRGPRDRGREDAPAERAAPQRRRRRRRRPSARSRREAERVRAWRLRSWRSPSCEDCGCGIRPLAGRRVAGDAVRGVERLAKIAEDVVGMFEADRQAHVAGRDAGRELLLRASVADAWSKRDGSRASAHRRCWRRDRGASARR